MVKFVCRKDECKMMYFTLKIKLRTKEVDKDQDNT